MSADREWLRRLAGWGLEGASSPGKPDGPVEEQLVEVRREKLIGVLHAAGDQGAVPFADHEASAVGRAHEAAMREALLLEDVLLDALEVLRDAEVDHRVLKGSALAHLVHPDPSQRSFGDNDVLVPASRIDRAVGALVDAGAERVAPALSSDFDRRFAKSVTLRWRGPSELDLHRTLAAGRYGFTIRLDDLWTEPAEFVLAGRVVPTLPLTFHLVHSALHVALGDVTPRLGNLRDVALLARAEGDPERAIGVARRWGCTAPFAAGVRAAGVLGHAPSALERWAAAHPPSRLDRLRLSAYARQRGRYRRQAVGALAVLGWRDRLAFGRALLRRR